MDMEVNGTRIYATIADPYLSESDSQRGLLWGLPPTCIASTPPVCLVQSGPTSSSESPDGQEGGYWGVFFHKDTSGERNGVCLPGLRGGEKTKCYDFDGTENTTILSTMGDKFTCGDCGLAEGPNQGTDWARWWLTSHSLGLWARLKLMRDDFLRRILKSISVLGLEHQCTVRWQY